MEKPKKTTIQISIELREILNSMKIHPRQSYDDLLFKLIKKE